MALFEFDSDPVAAGVGWDPGPAVAAGVGWDPGLAVAAGVYSDPGLSQSLRSSHGWRPFDSTLQHLFQPQPPSPTQ